MSTLTNILRMSAVTVALASGLGLAQAQSNGATGDPLINPDPSAPLNSTAGVDDMATTPAPQGRLAGEGVKSNTTYGHTRESSNLHKQPASANDVNTPPASPENTLGKERQEAPYMR
jgi:hypothetical protein